MDPDELAAWLRLLHTPQVGRESARKLLSAFGSAEAVLAASTLSRRAVVSAQAAAALANPPEGADALLQATRAWLQAGSAEEPHSVVVPGHPHYPTALLEIADPPLLLYAQGQLEWMNAPSLAVVGTRNPTPQGIQNAANFSARLSAAGLTVVSGLALGIDGAAHENALPQAGRTIAVVGTGLDRVYPRRHLDLAHRIAAQGLILSEYPLGSPPLPAHFPQRNRIIAGLSRGILVVEAAVKSGSLITARLGLDAGRDIFAIPGSIHSPLSRGCHVLIQQGARLVETAQDVLEELGWGNAHSASQRPAPDPGQNGDPLLAALAFDPVHLDALIARTGCSAAALNTRLLELELQGHVARLPGQLFQRIATT